MLNDGNNSCALVIFGVTGDLARKKLLPAIFDLANQGLLPANFGLIGFGRRDWSDEYFTGFVKESIEKNSRTGFNQKTWEKLSEKIRFVQGTFDDQQAFRNLSKTVDQLTVDEGTKGNCAFYMSVPPSDFPLVIRQLGEAGLNKAKDEAWRRIIIEKPFGRDLKSAQELTQTVEEVFEPQSIFRIDHYLGKEMAQNILTLRFANEIFEPLWNAGHIDHVQITMAESIGIGTRAGYYDGIGAARDVVQNHLLQLLALTAMEKPETFSAQTIAEEKTKVLSALEPPEDLATGTVRGQYVAGFEPHSEDAEQVLGYLEENGVDPNSTTETYAAVRLTIHNKRWNGVPFYLRAGKRLKKRVTEIALVFKKPPTTLPTTGSTDDINRDSNSDTNAGINSGLAPNALVLRIQPNEGATLRLSVKAPGTPTRFQDISMDFSYDTSFDKQSPEAYERLFHDVFLGDHLLFPTTEQVNLSWKIFDPIEEYWAADGTPESYESGTWGPAAADEMLARDGRAWRRP